LAYFAAIRDRALWPGVCPGHSAVIRITQQRLTVKHAPQLMMLQSQRTRQTFAQWWPFLQAPPKQLSVTGPLQAQALAVIFGATRLSIRSATFSISVKSFHLLSILGWHDSRA